MMTHGFTSVNRKDGLLEKLLILLVDCTAQSFGNKLKSRDSGGYCRHSDGGRNPRGLPLIIEMFRDALFLLEFDESATVFPEMTKSKRQSTCQNPEEEPQQTVGE
jgi:hypothetical protein